jgi:hypothetical protein
LREEAVMANVIETFIEGMRPLEQLGHSNRRFQIRKRITQYQTILRSTLADAEKTRSFLQQAKDAAVAEITRNSPDTPTAEFFQEIVDALTMRIQTSIYEFKDGTFQVNVLLPGLPHVVKDDFASLKAAQDWVDSDIGNQIIKDAISRFRPG